MSPPRLSERFEGLRPKYWPSPSKDPVGELHRRRIDGLPSAYSQRDWDGLVTALHPSLVDGEPKQVLIGWLTIDAFAEELSFPVLRGFPGTHQFPSVASCLFSLTRLLFAHHPGSIKVMVDASVKQVRDKLENVIPSGYVVEPGSDSGATLVVLSDQITACSRHHVWRMCLPGQLSLGNQPSYNAAIDWPGDDPANLHRIRERLVQLINQTHP